MHDGKLLGKPLNLFLDILKSGNSPSEKQYFSRFLLLVENTDFQKGNAPFFSK